MAEQEDDTNVDEVMRIAREMRDRENARVLYGTSATPLPFDDIKIGVPHKESVLSEAKRLVEGGERNQAYGPPEMDFERIAEMMNALFKGMLKEERVFLPVDVARIMILLKLSRSTWQMKRDNWVDIAGYAACGHRCETGEW